MRIAPIFILIIFSTLTLTAKEGMFMMDGITPAIAKDMRKDGFELDPADIWNPGKRAWPWPWSTWAEAPVLSFPPTD